MIIGILLVFGGFMLITFVRELGPEAVIPCSDLKGPVGEVALDSCQRMYVAIDYLLVGGAVILISVGIVLFFSKLFPGKGWRL